jgi:hypothetical protein
MNKEAYPQGFKYPAKPPFNLKKWKDTALKIRLAGREYPEYTYSEILTYFTSDWEFQEKESFKNWWKYNQTKQGRQNMIMQKTAYDYNSASKEQELNEIKKKLRSRVNSAEKLLNKMLDEGLLGENEEKALYISRIIQKLKEEINTLRRPRLMEARHKRVSTIFRKAGLDEIAGIMSGSAQIVAAVFKEQPLVKVAQENGGHGDLRKVMDLIKEELDTFNYGEHLEMFMRIKGELTAAGRHSEASMVVDIIKKELGNVDGIHKKLVEIYSSLGQVPRRQQPERPRQEPGKERPVAPVPAQGPEVPAIPR